MTEADWLLCDDPRAMRPPLRGVARDRKARLWACACCRRVWHLVADPRSRRAVEAAELFADGLIGGDKLEPARRDGLAAANEDYDRWERAVVAAGGDLGDGDAPHVGHLGACAGTDLCWVACWEPGEADAPRTDWVERVSDAAADAVRHAADPDSSAAPSGSAAPAARAAERRERAAQADLLRCVFGNPFRPAAFSPAWRTPDAVGVARAVYESRDFAVAPILADALEDAGCDAADLLDHLRGPGPHVRGCWAVDSVLGRA